MRYSVCNFYCTFLCSLFFSSSKEKNNCYLWKKNTIPYFVYKTLYLNQTLSHQTEMLCAQYLSLSQSNIGVESVVAVNECPAMRRVVVMMNERALGTPMLLPEVPIRIFFLSVPDFFYRFRIWCLKKPGFSFSGGLYSDYKYWPKIFFNPIRTGNSRSIYSETLICFHIVPPFYSRASLDTDPIFFLGQTEPGPATLICRQRSRHGSFHGIWLRYNENNSAVNWERPWGILRTIGRYIENDLAVNWERLGG